MNILSGNLDRQKLAKLVVMTKVVESSCLRDLFVYKQLCNDTNIMNMAHCILWLISKFSGVFSKLLILHVRLAIYCKLFLIVTIAYNNTIIVSTFFLQLQAIEKCHHLSYEDISFLETHPRNEFYSRFEQTKKNTHISKKMYTWKCDFIYCTLFCRKDPRNFTHGV